ncbi:unnamed protein product, partial [marine sediment metagenome]
RPWLDDKAAEIVKLHENIKRIPLDHIDQGNSFVMMREKFSLTESDIAAIVGKSVSYVSQHVSLVSQDEDLIRSVRDRKISFSQARELMAVNDTTERRRLRLICEESGATVEVLRTWIKDHEKSLLINPPSSLSDDSFSYVPDQHQDWRSCAACGKATEIKHIRLVYYCPECDFAIKKAIFEEKSLNTPKNTNEDSQKQS